MKKENWWLWMIFAITCLILSSTAKANGIFGRRYVEEEPEVKQQQVAGYDKEGRPYYLFPGRRPKPEPRPNPDVAPMPDVPTDYSVANTIEQAKKMAEIEDLKKRIEELKEKPKDRPIIEAVKKVLVEDKTNPLSALIPIGSTGLLGVLLNLGVRGYKFWSTL